MNPWYELTTFVDFYFLITNEELVQLHAMEYNGTVVDSHLSSVGYTSNHQFTDLLHYL
jgi:hypothetical protein